MHDIIIRQERADDKEDIYTLVKTAFAQAEHTDGKEQDLVNKLRVGGSYIPELTLVAEHAGKIVGFIMFTKITIGDSIEVALAPLAVAPTFQRTGIGSKLITTGHGRASALGYHYSVVLGSEDYYPQFGYERAANVGIHAPFDVPSENFMVHRLQRSDKIIEGIVGYPSVFFE